MPDKCRWCHKQEISRAVRANPNAEENFNACPYRFECADCSGFRGFVGRELEQLLERNSGAPQPIRLGVRTKKKTDDDDTRPSPPVTP